MIQDSSTSKTEQAAAMSGVQYHDAESIDAYCEYFGWVVTLLP